MAGMEFDGIGEPLTRDDIFEIERSAMEEVCLGQTGMTLEERFEHHREQCGGDLIQAIFAMNAEWSETYRVLRSPPEGAHEGMTIREPSKEEL